MNLEELQKFNGKGESGKIYVSVQGIIFDVSSKEVYQEGGSYALLAGHDATFALAKMKLEVALLDFTKYKIEELD